MESSEKESEKEDSEPSVNKEPFRDSNENSPNTSHGDLESSTELESMSAQEKARKMEEDYNALGVKRCSSCNFTTDEENLFTIHMTTCTKKQVSKTGQILLVYLNGEYTCKTCCLTWKIKAEFDEHVVCHISEDPYVCMSCRKNYCSRQLIEQHAKLEHPNGDSKCGLRGMKKGRQFVQELETNGSLTLFGRVKIPKTPRSETPNTVAKFANKEGNQPNEEKATTSSQTAVSTITTQSSSLTLPTSVTAINQENSQSPDTIQGDQISEINTLDTAPALIQPIFPKPSQPNIRNETLPLLTNSVKTVNTTSISSLTSESQAGPISAQMPAKEKELSLADRLGPILKKLQTRLSTPPTPTSATIETTVNSKPVVTKPEDNSYSGNHQIRSQTKQLLSQGSNSQSAINSMFGIVNKATGVLQPTTIPSKIQRIVPENYTESKQIENPFYHIKDITQYTRPKTSTPATSSTTVTVSSHPVILIPIGPVIQPLSRDKSLPLQSFPLMQPGVHQSSQGQNLLIQPFQVSQSVALNQANGGPVQAVNNWTETSTSSNMPLQNDILGMNNTITDSSSQQIKHMTSHFPPQPNHFLMVNAPLSISQQVSTLPTRGGLSSNVLSPSTGQTLTTASGTSNLPFMPDVDRRTILEPPKYIKTTEMLEHQGNKEMIKSLNNIPSSTGPLLNNPAGTRYMFRIKPGNGFVCEACRKYTKNEQIFRNHIWNHFHVDQKACLSCTPENFSNREVWICKLVNDVVCNLIKKSKLETQRRRDAIFNQGEVISISDDDEENMGPNNPKVQSGTEVIVLDDEDSANSGFEIRIASSHTITEEEYSSAIGGPIESLREIVDKDRNDCHDTIIKLEENPIIKTSDDEKGDEVHTDVIGCKSQDKSGDDATETPLIKQDIHKAPQKADEANIAAQYNDTTKQTVLPAAGTARTSKTIEIKEYKPRDTKEPEDKSENLETVSVNESACAFYMCGYEQCSFTTFTPSKYKSHLRSNHLNEFYFICSHCGLKDYTEESHMKHLHTHASAKSFALYRCPVRMCSYKSNVLQYYIYHLNAHVPEDLNLKCVYCHKTFETTTKLQHHLRDNILKFVNCSFCPFKFGKKNIVTQHITGAHPDKLRFVTVTSQIVCLEREINFYNPPPAKHYQTCTNQEGNGTELINIPAILDQVQKESGSVDRNKDSITDENEKNVLEVTKTNKEPQIVQRQKKRGKSKNIGPKSLLCPHCNYLSYNIALYTKHLSLHDQEPDRERKFVCNFCPTSVDYLGTFKKHMVNHLGRHEIKVYNCTLCGFSTNLKCHIMDHCQDNHDGTGMYTFTTEVVISSETSCKFCEFKSRQADQVVLHEKLVHQVQSSGATERKDNAELSKNSKGDSLQRDKVERRGEGENETSKKHKYHCDYCKMYFKHKVQLIKHLEESHNDIKEKKFTFYKCKYCPLGSTRKDMIVGHLENEHAGKDIRILRKIEEVENKPQTNQDSDENKDQTVYEEVVIPDGNVFKTQFRCPKCTFTTLLRLNAIRHLKEHPGVKPVREKDVSGSKKTARKSTSQRLGLQPKPRNALLQQAELKENPFTVVKDAVDKLRESDKSPNATYNLGEEDLHLKLSACFVPIEKDIKYKCKICEQDITKKFVLHRHILDHLNVMFFKCQYCDDGSVEKTLLFGHIQKAHPQQSLLYHQLGKKEIDEIIEKRIGEHNFVVSSTLVTSTVIPAEANEHIAEKKHKLTKDKVTQLQSSTEKKIGFRNINKSFQCTFPHCVYRAHRKILLNSHLLYHGDKTKDHKCSLCHFRNVRYKVVSHIYKQHKGISLAKAIPADLNLNSPDRDRTQEQHSRESSVDNIHSLLNSEQKYVKNKKGKKIKIQALTFSKNGIYEMRNVFKCKDCGEKKESKSGLYKHFKTSKCKRPLFQCSFCSFQRYTKIDIIRHAKIRHPGKKLEILSLPLTSKMSKLKIPVRQDIPDENIKREVLDDKDTSLNAQLNTSSTSSNGSGNEEVTCGLCLDFKCESVMKLQFHINTVHDGSLLLCQECQYKTPLIKHMRNHCTNVHLQKVSRYRTDGNEKNKIKTETNSSSMNSELDTYPCVLCSYKTPWFGQIKFHYCNHFKYKPFVCKYCDAKLQERKSIKIHVKNLHPGKPIKYKSIKKPSIEAKIERYVVRSKNMKKSRAVIKDEITPEKSSKKRPLQYDSMTESHVRKQPKLEDSKTFGQTLVKCEDMSENSSTMKFQVSRDEDGKRIFKCYQCEYTSRDKQGVKHHMSTHISRFFKCFYCTYSSKMRCNAKRHCRRMHLDKEPKIIEKKSGQVFTFKDLEPNMQGLADRSAKKYTRLRYNCCVCDKSFEEIGIFENHLSSHSKFQGNQVTFKARVGLTHTHTTAARDNGMDTSADVPSGLNSIVENVNVQSDRESTKKENVELTAISSSVLYSYVEEAHTSENKETEISASQNSTIVKSYSPKTIENESSSNAKTSGDNNIVSVKQMQDEQCY